ncbi:intraflagellar transport protein 22 homolog [Macaca thibetana thibetana]|uniref:intraflagellar transport protein 22 homolog n=1 Tax=Macaca thibetana thibetana TaxID=257877 RepID=UPI0021BC50E5|nr:intraflagellar transport protein 22 homolog [Macaca thibetana thibetana]
METTAARECSARTRQLWWAPADYAAADSDAEGQDPLRGALESGKTVLANVLTESSDITEYSPTQGVRFESCWPALMKDAHRVVIVFSADIPSHRKEMEMWYSCFVQQQSLQDTQCMLIAHHKPGSGDDKGSRSLSAVLRVKFLDQQQSALSRKCESSGPTQICGSRNSWSRAQQSVG